MTTYLHKCLECGHWFMPKTAKHFFCCREHYMKWYRRKSKDNKYPSFVCPDCGEYTQIDFHPKQSIEKWASFKCPFCGYEPPLNIENLLLIRSLF